MDVLTPKPRSGGGKPRSPIGERTARIEGSFRRISVHQLVLAWWLYQSGHMTRRQYRVYFAAHEIAERRRYTSPEHRGAKPLFTLDELTALVGGRGSPKAASELRADVRALGRLGLVSITKHTITFAVSVDQIRLDDISGFWSMFEQIPNRKRSVPVPRRLLRALAAGFSKAVTALVTAILIRGLFWQRDTQDYRTDGRYKLSWVAKHFGISRRAASDARAKLIGLGWIEPMDVSHWELNQWGLRDRIVTEWSHKPAPETVEAVGGGDLSGAPETGARKLADPPTPAAESASPNRVFAGESASPDLTDSLSLSGDRKNRKLPTRERSGVSTGSTFQKRQGSRKKSHRGRSEGEPNIRDIQAKDLESTDRLLDLHRQACELGLVGGSESGRLDFLALAERARSRGKRAGALFYWLLRERKFAFITHHDEDEAARRLREHFNGRRPKHREREQWGGTPRRIEPEWTDDDKTVMACLRIAQQRRIDDPFHLARQAKGWNRDHWDAAHFSYHQKQVESWKGTEIQHVEY